MPKKHFMRRVAFLFVLIFPITVVHSVLANNNLGSKTVTLWEPYLEWNLSNSSWSGNAFDLIATATFTHVAGEVITTGMFFANNDTWKFRFTGTKTGLWSFNTNSTDPELNGHTGTITVIENPDENTYGFTTGVGTKWVRPLGNTGDLQAFVPNFHETYFAGAPVSWTEATVNSNIIRIMEQHGFTGTRVSMAAGWVDAELGSGRFDETPNRDPDPDTFENLERLISSVHQAGGLMHIWYSGDCSRKQCPQYAFGDNGASTPGEQRLLRYIAARLAPLPGWIMGYGYDVPEVANTTELESWGEYLRKQMGWKHMLSARDQGPEGQAYTFMPSADWYSHGDWFSGLDYNEAVNVINNNNTDRPHAFDERWWTRRVSQVEQRKLRWKLMMAGGASAIWANDRNGNSYSNPHWYHTVTRFWRDRFLLDMQPDNTLTDSGAIAMASSSGQQLVFYAENTNQINLDLSRLSKPRQAIAVDVTAVYAEIDLGMLDPTSQAVNLPNNSDWAIAVGDFDDKTPVVTELIFKDTFENTGN